MEFVISLKDLRPGYKFQGPEGYTEFRTEKLVVVIVPNYFFYCTHAVLYDHPTCFRASEAVI